MTKEQMTAEIAAFNATQDAKASKRRARRTAKGTAIEAKVQEGYNSPALAAAIASESRISAI